MVLLVAPMRGQRFQVWSDLAKPVEPSSARDRPADRVARDRRCARTDLDAGARSSDEGRHPGRAIAPQEHDRIELHARAERRAAGHQALGAGAAVEALQVERAGRGANRAGESKAVARM